MNAESTLPKEAVFLEEGADLYACELPDEATKCTLKDLTVGRFGESADVLGVLGASEDGSYVYFVANGVLAAGASPRHLRGRTQAQRNLQPLRRPLRLTSQSMGRTALRSRPCQAKTNTTGAPKSAASSRA